MKAEELLEKLKRLDRIAFSSLITTTTIYKEDWYKRVNRYKINLINQFKKEVDEEALKIIKEIYSMSAPWGDTVISEDLYNRMESLIEKNE